MVTTTEPIVATKLTLEQFLAREQTKPAEEYWDGEVEQKAMPTGEHGVIESLLSFVFRLFVRDHPTFDCGPEIRCNFRTTRPRYSPVPDFIVVLTERLPHGRLRGHVEGPPDIAIEVLSPDDRMTKVMRKVRFYLAHGVRIVWLINPYDRSVTVWTATAPRKGVTVDDDGVLDGGEVLPEFTVAVRDILPPPDLDVSDTAVAGDRPTPPVRRRRASRAAR